MTCPSSRWRIASESCRSRCRTRAYRLHSLGCRAGCCWPVPEGWADCHSPDQWQAEPPDRIHSRSLRKAWMYTIEPVGIVSRVHKFGRDLDNRRWCHIKLDEVDNQQFWLRKFVELLLVLSSLFEASKRFKLQSNWSKWTSPTSTVETSNESALVDDRLVIAIAELSSLTGELIDVDGLADFEAIAPEQALAAHHVGSLEDSNWIQIEVENKVKVKSLKI